MKQSHQKIYVAVYFLKTTDSAFSKLLELENSQLRNEYFNSWVFLCISLVGPWKTEDLSDARREPHRASFPLFWFFFSSRLVWVTRVWAKPLVFIQATTIWSFLWISLTKCVDRNTRTPFTPRHIYIKKKKQESHPVLATSLCLALIFAVAFSFIICSLLLLYHEDIFEKRNVQLCLQCPPHWNTWGKVSSVTLWSIPTSQLEPKRLDPRAMRIFYSWWWGIFLTSSSSASLSNWN